MKKAMISQPINGISEDVIRETRQKAIQVIKDKGYNFLDSYFDDEWAAPDNMKNRGVVNIPVAFLAKSLERMSMCDAVYFCKGWENARGCKIEHDVAVAYGLEIIEEE